MKNFALRSCAAILCIAFSDCCIGTDTLFFKQSRTYGRGGLQGRTFQRQFEERMFKRARWRQRLYISVYEPAVDDTLEVYVKPDGSRCLSHFRATPSLSRIIEPAPSGTQYDIEKELSAMVITSHDITLPPAVADEIEMLWKKMLPGLPNEPNTIGGEHVLVPHAPSIIAFGREGSAVKTGQVAMVAYNTPAYREFVSIADDLIETCDGGSKPSDPIFVRLTDKIRRLRTRL
jgi:hypothetical protein